jgi:hypothetical protein
LFPSIDLVQWGRKNRRMNAVEKEIESARVARRAVRPEALLGFFDYRLRPVAFAILTVVFWGADLSGPFPPSLFAPFSWLLAMPAQSSGSLGVLGWCLVAHYVLSPVVEGALRLADLIPAKDTSGDTFLEKAMKFGMSFLGGGGATA